MHKNKPLPQRKCQGKRQANIYLYQPFLPDKRIHSAIQYANTINIIYILVARFHGSVLFEKKKGPSSSFLCLYPNQTNKHTTPVLCVDTTALSSFIITKQGRSLYQRTAKNTATNTI
eukprot:TRINITY_DN1188_c0_g1_i2.p1 TRINITY_DN1188_c0_g1~~TRINITY_DN1188_c0_g1_i2.p1  ORF type:complete len:117 (-),score=9.02 TRINITY_DN1188_c0_g1_i2:30-380(-)